MLRLPPRYDDDAFDTPYLLPLITPRRALLARCVIYVTAIMMPMLRRRRHADDFTPPRAADADA